MATGVVTVGRRQYVSGLYWENSPSGRISQAAKEAAHQPGANADFYATRSGNKQGRVPQFGLTGGGAGLVVRSGLPSLAGCLANQQPGSWIGAFRLREGTALVVIRDDLIVPDGDLFFTDEAEARDHLYQEMAVGGFQRIYAPEAWGVPGADSMPLSLLLNDRSDVKLRAVTLTQQVKTVFGVGFFVLLIILGAGWYLQYQKAQQDEQDRLEMEAMEKLQQQVGNLLPMNQVPEYPKPERTWEEQPQPLNFIDACKEALDKVKVGVAGWQITTLHCAGGNLSIQWRRQGGFSSLPKDSIVSDTGNDASSSVALENLSPRGSEELDDPDAITRRYLSQNWTGTLQREADDPLPLPPPGYTGEWNPPPPPWVKRSFTFNVPILPWTLSTFLDGLPGAVVRSMSQQGSGGESQGSWTVEGVIYENRR